MGHNERRAAFIEPARNQLPAFAAGLRENRARLIDAIAEQRGLVLGEGALDYLVPRAERSFAEGAALILTYGTSIHALLDRGHIKEGDTLLILGAAGGVGLAAGEAPEQEDPDAPPPELNRSASARSVPCRLRMAAFPWWSRCRPGKPCWSW